MNPCLHKRRTINNLQVLSKIQNNSLVYFSSYQNLLVQESPQFSSDQARICEGQIQKLENTRISINQWVRSQKKAQQVRDIKMGNTDSNENKIYQNLLMQSRHLEFSNLSFNPESNKENNFDSSNQSPFGLSSRFLNESENQSELMEKVNSKLMNAYSCGVKNIHNLEKAQNLMNSKKASVGKRRLQIIEKLINVLETNKEHRIRGLYEERQSISKAREEQKKFYKRKLDQVKEIEFKYRNRKIDERTAVFELGGLRG